jgi:hypothetical protein
MTDLDIRSAVAIAEGIEDASIDAQLEAWQTLLDTGLVWQLQGWFGRTAILLIEQGLIKEAQDA